MPPWSGGHAAFGAAIREIRQERALPRRRLALDAALDRSYFGEVERGERNVSLANIFRIADALGVRPRRSTRGRRAGSVGGSTVDPCPRRQESGFELPSIGLASSVADG